MLLGLIWESATPLCTNYTYLDDWDKSSFKKSQSIMLTYISVLRKNLKSFFFGNKNGNKMYIKKNNNALGRSSKI